MPEGRSARARERSHLFSPEVDLDRHVEDIVAVPDYEDLTDVIPAVTANI
jgi:hypothetical protein